MTDQKERPDFIVDEFGHVRDVRHLKTPGSDRLNTVYTHSGDGNQAKSQLQAPGGYTIIPIGLLITIIVLIFRSAATPQSRNTAIPTHESVSFLNTGKYYYDEGDYEKAIAQFNIAIGMEPDLGDAYNGRGLAYYAQGNYDRALLDFERAIQLQPDHANAYNNRGITYFAKGDTDRAIGDFSKAINLFPGFAKAYYNRGLVYNSLTSFDMAIADFDMAISYTPDILSNKLKDVPTEAMGLINSIKEAQPYADLPLVYFNRGLAHLGKGDSELAKADFNQALELGLDSDIEQKAKQLLEGLQ